VRGGKRERLTGGEANLLSESRKKSGRSCLSNSIKKGAAILCVISPWRPEGEEGNLGGRRKAAIIRTQEQEESGT